MYLSIPEVFFIPVYYHQEEIFNIKRIVISQECNSCNNFINKTAKREEIVIGVSLPDQVVPRWSRERKIMEEYAKSKGITLKVENAEFDSVKQASQVDNLIS